MVQQACQSYIGAELSV